MSVFLRKDPNDKKTTVFLRPQPAATPFEYINVIGKAGLIVMPQRNLAIYTMSQGRRGPMGEDRNSWYDTIIDAATDEESPITVTVKRKSTFRNPYPMDLTTGHVRASLGMAPEGADFIIDVYMNGVSMFDTLIHIDDGSETSVGSATPVVLNEDALYIPDDAKYEVFVRQIGTIVSGAGLKIAITGVKTQEQGEQ